MLQGEFWYNRFVMKKRVRLGILLLIIFGGYALRVHQLDRFSFWLDEGLTPLRSSYAVRAILSNVIVIQAANSQDTHPPLYYLLIHLTRQLFGTSDFAFRYPSVLLSVLLIPVLARFGRKVSVAFIRLTTKARRREDITLTTEHLFSLLIALLVAINPQQIWYAQEARMYSQLVLLMAVASYILWDAWHNPARPLWQSVMGYAVFAGLAAYTHYTALFLIVGQSPMWLWLLWRSGQKRLILAGGAGAVVAVMPFAPFVIKRLLGPDETSYFPVAPQVFIADIVRGFGFGRTVDYTHPSITFLLLMLSAILLYGIWRAQRATRLFLLIYLLATVFGLMAGSYIFKPMYLGPHH
ncbi:MAG TPA: hypothetical protein ENJ56_06015, partial [Anaerolineae bacterium]|nr:hypothetical protein [Anaerolineae bacterium]